jgi:tellurite resistance protein TehA-like permease
MHDRKRQTILNLLCFVGATNAVFYYPIAASQNYRLVHAGTTLVMLIVVLFGLVIINHNSLSRLNNISVKYRVPQFTLNCFCTLLYVTPIVHLLCVYYFFDDEFLNSEKSHSVWVMSTYVETYLHRACSFHRTLCNADRCNANEEYPQGSSREPVGKWVRAAIF